jgi:hypothetical protein
MQDRGRSSLSYAPASRRSVQVKAGAADDAGIGVAFGRVTDQARRFVDDQEVGVFVEDGEQVVQTRGDFNREIHEIHERRLEQERLDARL